MNKTAIKNFAIWAREKLMSDIRTRLGFVGITEQSVAAPLDSSTKEIQYYATAGAEPLSITGSDISSRKRIVDQLELEAKQGNYKTAYETLVENTASAWFNRLIAIRFMEVNGYLSDGIRMLSSTETGKQDPDIVTTPFDSDLEFTDAEREEIIQAKLKNETDKVFRILFFKRCHQLHKALPGIFEGKDDATEFLMRLSVIDTDGVIYHLVHDIAEEDFDVSKGGQVEIIGWMYQYYNTELKDDTFAKLKKNIKITKERIPAATQLFTPDWIVRYMVENSVGRIWIEHLRAVKPETDEKKTAEKFGWKYYLPEAEQKPEVAQQLVSIRKTYENIRPTDIKCIDPCMGSGHILVAMFDVLMDIYLSEGYDEREAAFDIVENNLHGLDIDVRAYQLAYFAVMMKGLQYNRRFLSGRKNDDGERIMVAPRVFAIEESNLISKSYLKYYGTGMDELSRTNAVTQMTGLLDAMKDAKEYGSILNIDNYDWKLLRSFVSHSDFEGQMTLDFADAAQAVGLLGRLINIGEVLANKYDAVVTNPPYMNIASTAGKLNAYVKKKYSENKSDLYGVFVERCALMAKNHGYQAMITQHTWMFLSRSENLRNIVLGRDIINLNHLGTRAFEEIGGEVVQTVAFTLRNSHCSEYIGKYVRLVDYNSEQEKKQQFCNTNNYYFTTERTFDVIPGRMIIYWQTPAFMKNFESKLIGDVIDTRVGLDTGNNDKYIRLWFEVDWSRIKLDAESEKEIMAPKKWVPHTKGGAYRKWYGNFDCVLAFDSQNYNLLLESGNHLPSRQFYFREGITWSRISTSSFAVRYTPEGMVFNSACPTAFADQSTLIYSLGLLNSVIVNSYVTALSPTMNFQAGDINSVC